MNTDQSNGMAGPNPDELTQLERQLDELLAICQRLEDENRSLKATQESLVAERANLVAKNEQARSRVEAMISRLRTLEQGV